MNPIQYIMPSPIGPLYLVASEKGLRGVFWKKQKSPVLKSLAGQSPSKTHLKNTKKQFEEYFFGRRTRFDLKFDIEGTDFQKQVWRELSKIPFGKTCSYRDIAKKIGRAKAFRAVGTANGKNPLSIIVPCHRVIAADGTLGGYAGGLKIKRHLLALEKASKSGG